MADRLPDCLSCGAPKCGAPCCPAHDVDERLPIVYDGRFRCIMHDGHDVVDHTCPSCRDFPRSGL